MTSTPDEPTLDDQYRKPVGEVGQRIGQEMAQDHLPENQWTVTHLAPHPSDHLLEIGFGPGVAIELLLPHIPHGKISGIDHSQLMVSEAQQRNAAAVQAGQVNLQHGSADTLPFSDATFDKVFGIHTVYFWSAPMQTLREIYRVLKPSGTVLITMLPKDRWQPNMPGAPIEYGTPECTPYFTHELEAMLREAGFAQTSVVIDDDPVHRSNVSVIGVK